MIDLTDYPLLLILRADDARRRMGAFHDLLQPQQLANLRARLDVYTPAGPERGLSAEISATALLGKADQR
jgi:hypothetical protein